MWLLVSFFLGLATAPAEAAQSSPEWSLHLDAKMEALSFPETYGENTNQNLYRLELDPIYTWKYLDSWKFFFKPNFTADPINHSESERFFFDPSETYIRYQSESFSIQSGYNIFSWGVTDGYNPLDLLNQKQYFNPLRSRKLGTPSLVFSKTFDIWDYELIYIPQNREAILPGTESRWLPRKTFVPQTPDNDLVLILPETLHYQYADRSDPDNARDHNAAFRIQRRGSTIDLSLIFYEGLAAFPLIQPVVTGTIVQISPKTVIAVDPNVLLNTKNYRIRQGGFTFVSSQKNFLFKYATSYIQSLGDDPLMTDWTHENVLGLEKTFNLGSQGLMIAVLQHAFINSQRADDSNFSTTEIFRRAWMLGGKMSWKEFWNISILALYDDVHSSHFEEVAVSRRFLDKWVVTLTVDNIQGPAEAPLGVYEKNDSYSLSLSRSF